MRQDELRGTCSTTPGRSRTARKRNPGRCDLGRKPGLSAELLARTDGDWETDRGLLAADRGPGVDKQGVAAAQAAQVCRDRETGPAEGRVADMLAAGVA